MRFVNNGASIGIDKLVLGETTKYDNENQIGKYGEGLKLALLVLVRNGHQLEIKTQEQIWTPLSNKAKYMV